MNQVDSESALRVLQLNATFEAFGIVMDYLADRTPFSTFEAGNLAKAVQRQLRGGHHLVAMQGRSAVGYLGWMPTTNEIAQKWLDGTGQLKPADAASTDAVALTIVAADLPQARSRLIRNARMLNKTVRVYFKRGAMNGRPARKVSLMSQNTSE